MLRAFLSVFVLVFSVTCCSNSCSGRDTIFSIVEVEDCQEISDLVGEISRILLTEELEDRYGSHLLATSPQLQTDGLFANQYEHRGLFGGLDPEPSLLVADQPLVVIGGAYARAHAHADSLELEIWSMEMRSGTLTASDNFGLRRASKSSKGNLQR